MYNISWGHSPCIRKAFLDTYNGKSVEFGYKELMVMDYPDHEGDPGLVELTRGVIKRQVGLEYKHVLLTNGATGAIDIALRAYKKRGVLFCVTREAPWYSRYPSQIHATGMVHDPTFDGKKAVILNDLPGNPTGTIEPVLGTGTQPVILDAVYLNGVYSHIKIPVPKHEVLIGSYSKLLGINGIRVGWIATNDNFLYEYMSELVTVEYCGLSAADTVILKSILKKLDWDIFECKGRFNLDGNRTEWSKLQKYFVTPISPIGMFHYSYLDSAAQKLLEKAEVTYMKGSALGTNSDYGRFNLGADNLVIRDVVRKILKIDKIKK